jgi:hypothetical protein
VGVQRLSAVAGQVKGGHRLAIREGFFDRNQPGGLEPAGVRRQVAIGQPSPLSQLHKMLRGLASQRRQNPQPPGIDYCGIE